MSEKINLTEERTDESFDLERYLTGGVERIVRSLVKGAMFHPRESLFMAKYAAASVKSSALRREAEERGEHVPPFLIASITSLCNLHCAGCYARSLDSCTDGEPTEQMKGDDWARIFGEAREMGVGFILLAGGEPLVRRDVLDAAANYPELLFPVFTNGTMLKDDYLDLFDRSRNLVPILSIEGGRRQTDARRGTGMYERIERVMGELSARHIAFGASVTVTTENFREVLDDTYIADMEKRGCKGIIYVEFVPTNESLRRLALGDAEREQLAKRVRELRDRDMNMLIVSFPGDEKTSGGCLAAGRGFFHINSHGGAEPCPFSPYSDFSLRDHTLREAMNAPFFRRLRESGVLAEDHDGGCVLYQRREEVERIQKSEL